MHVSLGLDFTFGTSRNEESGIVRGTVRSLALSAHTLTHIYTYYF